MQVQQKRHVLQPAETRRRQKGIEFRAWASQMRVAFARMAWNTGSSSPANELMTCSTSEVAVCCSRASFSSRIKAERPPSLCHQRTNLAALLLSPRFGASASASYDVAPWSSPWPLALERLFIATPLAEAS